MEPARRGLPAEGGGYQRPGPPAAAPLPEGRPVQPAEPAGGADELAKDEPLADSKLAAIWPPLVLACGFDPVPNLLIRHRGRLGLSDAEAMFLLDLCTYPNGCWATMEEMAAHAGKGRQTAQEWKASLLRKGLIEERPLGRAKGRDRSATALFPSDWLKQLLEYYAWHHIHQRVMEGRWLTRDGRVKPLPAPRFLAFTPEGVPRLAPPRPGLWPPREPDRRATGWGKPGREKPTIVRRENPTKERREKATNDRRAGPTDDGRQKATRVSSSTGSPPVYSGELSRSSSPRSTTGPAAPRPADRRFEPPETEFSPRGAGGPEHVPPPSPLARPEGVYRPLDPSEQAELKARLDTAAAAVLDEQSSEAHGELPPGYDEGICAYVEEYAPLFGDNDPARTIEAAHHLWWNSRLPRWAFHNAMKAAAHATAQRIRTGRLRGRPMAYFFTLLRAAVEDQRLRQAGPRAGTR